LDLGARRGHDEERGECGGKNGGIGFATTTAAAAAAAACVYMLFLLLSVVALVVILGSGT